METNGKEISVVAVVSALLLTLAIAVSGQGPQGRGGPPPGGGFPGGPGREGLGLITRDLNLSDEQKAQIQKSLKASRKTPRPFRISCERFTRANQIR